MHPILNKILITFFTVTMTFNFLGAGIFEDHRKNRMIQDLEVIKHNFEVGYAPFQWKKESTSFDIDQAYEIAKSQILNTPGITTKQFQQIVRAFVNSTKDYHVDVMFYSTESASLPFGIRGAEGRYFISWIDPIRVPPSYYSIRVGDELLEFDERPIAEVMEEILEPLDKGNDLTDRCIAEIKLTSRQGMAGDAVPKGPLLVTTRSATTGKLDTCQLHWIYHPESIMNSLDFLETIDFITDFFAPKNPAKLEIPQIEMVNPLHQAYGKISCDRAGEFGGRRSFVPTLGEVIWKREDDKKEGEQVSSLDDNLNWHTYIYRHANGQSIGYVRIPHYVFSSDLVKEFGQIIKIMEEKTDALVIDQVHNFGGYVDFSYKIVSYLANSPLRTPHHRVKITQREVANAYQMIEMIKFFELSTPAYSDDDSSFGEKKEGGQEQSQSKEEESGFNYQEILFLKAYYELILEDWNRGITLTRPTPINGVDRINPNQECHYTKPILMLIDEMDFSGGDFVPAILQDNKRATLFGTRTAGAGGFVSGFQFPNSHGIAFCSYTGSIADRPNMQKIENTGVTPDIEYRLTPEDLQGGYKGYVKAVNEAVQTLLQNSK